MSKKKSEINKIKQSIENANDMALQYTSRDITADAQELFVSVMYDFYKSYNPKKYKRTYRLYSASSWGARLYPKKIRKGSYMAGIQISSDFYTIQNSYRADTDWVFERSFEKGIHGFTKTERIKWAANNKISKYIFSKKAPKKMTPPPYKIIKNKSKDLFDPDMIFEKYNSYFSMFFS